MSPFKILGLDDAADIPQIKRAYARLLRTHRPDEDPAGFQRLHEAYEACLQQVHWRAIDDDAHVDDDGVEAAPHALGDAPVPARAPETAATESDEFALDAFFDEFLGVARDGWTDVDAWLRAHPALYSIADRALVADALVWRLLDEPPLPPRVLAAVLRHFELDQVNPRYQFHEAAIQTLRQDAAVAHGELDLSFMDGRRPQATPAGGRSLWWLVWIVFLVAHGARLILE